MFEANIQNGAQTANVLPDVAVSATAERMVVESLADLLSHLSTNPTAQTAMLRSTAGKISAFLNASPDQIPLDLVHANREGFRPFLESQRYKEGSIRSYVNYLRMLLELAVELGWRPNANLSPEWQKVVELAKAKGCLIVAKAMAQAKRSPLEVTHEDMERWLEASVKEGKRYSKAAAYVRCFWSTLVACGYAKNAPAAPQRQKNYGVALSDFPLPLREETAELLRWKTADYEPGRPKGARIREISADTLKKAIGRLLGYATDFVGFGKVTSMRQLIRKDVLEGYIAWCVNERKVKGASLLPPLGAVLAAVSQHPAYKDFDLSWFRPVLHSIPVESYDEVEARKAKKYLDYDILESIPRKIYAQRALEAKHGEAHIARIVMWELMITWLLILPWRQRNFRECRVAGQFPNLFKAKLPAFSNIDKPSWACQIERENPHAEFWQIKFSLDETKTGVSIHSLLPRQLIGLLEEYLSEYRPLLLKGRRCETLLVSPEADVVTAHFMNTTISDLTLRYGGRRVTPHLFRDIVAFAYLKAHSKDYLTLSKMLWHKDIATTIKYYAGRFNDSSAVVAMESWLEQRAAERKQK